MEEEVEEEAVKDEEASLSEWKEVYLTSSAQSEGVTAESGPSVVVWELSLGGEEDPAPTDEGLVSECKSVVAPTALAALLELRLSMSSSSSSGVSGPPPCSDDTLRSTESPGCKECWEERGCSVMMSAWLRDDTPDEEGASLELSPPTEAAGVQQMIHFCFTL